jgi:hypothetical protein
MSDSLSELNSTVRLLQDAFDNSTNSLPAVIEPEESQEFQPVYVKSTGNGIIDSLIH